jgi:hypothetical protein
MALAVPMFHATAQPVVAATYVGPCTTSPSSEQTDHTFVRRPFPTGDAMSGVTMDVHVRNLRVCTGGTSSVYDYPAAVLSLQRVGSGGTDIVQLGYVKCNKPGGLGNVPCDGFPHWVYTRGDNASGFTWLFDTFYGPPVVGQEYRLRISTYTTSGGNQVWQYCIRNKNTEPTYTCHTGGHQTGPGTFSHSRSWDSGRLAWYGTETQNKNSAQGTGVDLPNFEPYLNIRWMQYRRGGTWWIATPVNCEAQSVPGPRPSYFGCAVQSTVDVTGDGVINDQETIQPVTYDH